MLGVSPVSFANPHLINPLGKPGTWNLYTLKKEKVAGQGGAKPNRARGKNKTDDKK
jgi:hypothetical protein